MFQHCSVFLCFGIATLTIFLHQSEGLRVPAVIDGSWLDIQVAVDAHSLLTRVGAQGTQDDGWQGDLLSGGKLKGQKLKGLTQWSKNPSFPLLAIALT